MVGECGLPVGAVQHRRVRRSEGVRRPPPHINVPLNVESAGGEEAAAV